MTLHKYMYNDVLCYMILSLSSRLDYTIFILSQINIIFISDHTCLKGYSTNNPSEISIEVISVI